MAEFQSLQTAFFVDMETSALHGRRISCVKCCSALAESWIKYREDDLRFPAVRCSRSPGASSLAGSFCYQGLHAAELPRFAIIGSDGKAFRFLLNSLHAISWIRVA